MTHGCRIDFDRIARAALARADVLVRRWAPDGRQVGVEWVAINPRRGDHRLGSFKINTATGAWGDFADGAVGRDMVSLAAYLHGLRQGEAAIHVAKMLGIDPFTASSGWRR